MSCHQNEVFIENTREEFAEEFAILDNANLCAEDKVYLLIRLLGPITVIDRRVVQVLELEGRSKELCVINHHVYLEYKV